MNSTQLIDRLVDKTGLEKEDVENILVEMVSEMKKALHRGESVKIRNFGSVKLIKKRNVVVKGLGGEFKKDLLMRVKFSPSKNLLLNNSFGDLLNSMKDE